MKSPTPMTVGLILAVAAGLEVGGDLAIRRGLRGRGWPMVALGAGLLGIYGLLVNLVRWDFGRLLGTYVVVFAIVSVLVGRFGLGETVPPATWAGLALIVLGGLVIQWGAG